MEIKNNEISVYGNRKLQNYCKKKGIVITPKIELVNIYGKHYAYKLVDRTISMKDYKKCPKFEVKDVLSQVIEHFEKVYPNLDRQEVDEIIDQYCYRSGKDRKLSINIIKRSYALVVAHFRHKHTDYEGSYGRDSYEEYGHDEMKAYYNIEAHKLAKEAMGIN